MVMRSNRLFHFFNDGPQMQLLFYGDERCVPSHEYGGYRPYLLFHIVYRGKGRFQTDRRSWPLESGDCFVIFPDQHHLYKADSKEPWHYFWLGLDRSFVPYLERIGINNERPILKTERVDVLFHLYEEMIMGRELSSASSEMEDYALAFRIMADLLKSHNEQFPTSRETIRAPHVVMMRNYIENYFQTPINTGDVADYVHLERSYASRLFKEGTGNGIAQHIRARRLKEARKFLEEGFSVKQAAYSAGFQVYENFLKLFKKSYGITPGMYKKSQEKHLE
jgi:AraC-like DNA-binding protein